MARFDGVQGGRWLLALALGLGARGAQAEDAPPAGRAPEAVPRAEAPTLDGRLDEPGWQTALRLEADTLVVPPAPPGVEPVRLQPDVRLLEADGRLWIGVALAEDPGMGVGLRVMAGPDGLAGAADAVAIGYAPQEMRAARYSLRGPRGVTRVEAYPVDGAVDVGRMGAWSLELAVPLAELELGGPSATLCLALAVSSRAPNLVAAVPVGGLFSPPAAWLRLTPAAGAWSTASSRVDTEALRKQDAHDEARLTAWRDFLKLSQGGTAPGEAPMSVATYRAALLEPLRRIEGWRPDLLPWVAWVRGDVLQRLGELTDARAAYDAALAVMPGCREAAFQRDVKLLSQRLSEAASDQPTDFRTAMAHVNEAEAQPAEAQAAGAYAREGLRLARALLLYKQGELAPAIELLEPLARRFPAEPLIIQHLERARATLPELDKEQRQRALEAKRNDLPRLGLATSRGVVELELFEDDAPNSVRNVVWLAEKGFYDGTAFHSNVPFFGLQGGDPFTRPGADAGHVGVGGPGYAIPEERSPRPALRGTLCLVGVGTGTVASQFFFASGTAVHLKETVSAVGRIVAGQEVADRWVEGDRIEKVTVLRRRPGTVYRPTTLAGTPAPEPSATPLLR